MSLENPQDVYISRISFLMGHAGYFTYLGTPITEDGECTTEFRTWLNRGQAIGESLQKMWKSYSIGPTDFNEDTTNESASVACTKCGRVSQNDRGHR